MWLGNWRLRQIITILLGWAADVPQWEKQKGDFFLNQRIYNSSLSSDYFLQLENIKAELPVIVNQHVTVNLLQDFTHIARHAPGVNGCNAALGFSM